MSVSEQSVPHELGFGSLGSIVRNQLGATLPNDDSSESPLPLISPEVINLSALRPNDDSQEALFNDGRIGISPSEDHTGLGSSPRRPLDLHTLWRLLEQMDKEARKNGVIGDGKKAIGISSIDGMDVTTASDNDVDPTDDNLTEKGNMSTWELVVLQAVLLSLLIFISLLWAFCCKRKCLSDQPLMTEMVALARKISSGSSKDLPPSYSKVDLTQEGLTIDDHFNPPPTYDKAADLYHRDIELKRLEEGESRTSVGSSRNATPVPDYTPTLSLHQSRIRRLANTPSIASISTSSISSIFGHPQPESSNNNQGTKTCVVTIEQCQPSTNENDLPSSHRIPKSSVSSISSTSSSHSSSSRRTSRVTFSPILEEGPTDRKDSSRSLPCRSALVSRNNQEYRKRSAISEGGGGSRKVSFVFEELGAVVNGACSNNIRADLRPDLERALHAQLELARQAGEMDDFISSSNNLNNKGVKTSPPMI